MPTDLDVVGTIVAKRDGLELPAADLKKLVRAYTEGRVPDYQLSAFLMAGFLRGFTHAEAAALTQAFVESGECLDLSALAGPTVDKHSTGGVSDGTTLVVAPLVAAAGMQLLKLSGRGLGHTGGTIDKLESVPGLRTDLSPQELFDQVERVGLAVGAQTAEVVPADKAIYALRDVTGTIDNVALIASSIMSKKLAGGASAIVIDVKVGSGAFMKDLEAASELASVCVALGTGAGRSVRAVISDMNQPLGDMVGNAIEVGEAIEVLRGEREGRLKDLSIELAAELAVLARLAPDLDAARDRVAKVLSSGSALERFGRFIEAQGGDPRVTEDVTLLPTAPVVAEVRAAAQGWLAAVDTAAVGSAAGHLGAGRRRKEDTIDPSVGLELSVKLGDEVQRGTVIGRVFAADEGAAEAAAAELLSALHWSERPAPSLPLIYHRA